MRFRFSRYAFVVVLFEFVHSEGLDRPNRVVGGEPVVQGDFPWQVSLQVLRDAYVSPMHFCGGALIRKGWVLTAAHCLEDIDYSQVVVVLGAWNLEDESSGFRVLKAFKYYFNGQSMENDIALLKIDIDNPVVTQPQSKCTTIELEETLDLLDDNCFVSGWGQLSFDGEMPRVLHAGKVALVSDLSCATVIRASVFRSVYRMNVCAGGVDVDACQGDSGGPLVCCKDSSPPSSQTCRLVGVTSWGVGCAAPGIPGIYTEVAYYKTWIEETISREDN